MWLSDQEISIQPSALENLIPDTFCPLLNKGIIIRHLLGDTMVNDDIFVAYLTICLERLGQEESQMVFIADSLALSVIWWSDKDKQVTGNIF